MVCPKARYTVNSSAVHLVHCGRARVRCIDGCATRLALTSTQVELKEMNWSNGRTPGFSRLEMAFILVLVALVGVLAITQYLDLSRTPNGDIFAYAAESGEFDHE